MSRKRAISEEPVTGGKEDPKKRKKESNPITQPKTLLSFFKKSN